MIQSLFTATENFARQGALLAVVAAIAWGVFSIVFSPCHLSSVPLIIAYISKGKISTGRRAFLLSAVFSFGIFLSIAAVGLATALLGRMLGDIGGWGNYIVAAVFILFGLVLLDVIRLSWSPPGTDAGGPGIWGAFGLGLIFGLAVGPCTFAYMGPILAVVFREGRADFLFSVLLILAFGLGHCGVIILAGTMGAKIQRWLDWDSRHQLSAHFKMICGAVLIFVGLYLIYKAA